MTWWEYVTVNTDELGGWFATMPDGSVQSVQGELVILLNALGRDGWELAATGRPLVFKRLITNA